MQQLGPLKQILLWRESVNPDTSLFQSRKIVTITTTATKFHQNEFYRVFTAYKQNHEPLLLGPEGWRVRRFMNGGAYNRNQKKLFETSCSSEDQNTFFICLFSIKLQIVIINQISISLQAREGLISGGGLINIGYIFLFIGRWAYNRRAYK